MLETPDEARIRDRGDAEEALSTVVITDADGRIVSAGGVIVTKDIVLAIADGSKYVPPSN